MPRICSWASHCGFNLTGGALIRTALSLGVAAIPLPQYQQDDYLRYSPFLFTLIHSGSLTARQTDIATFALTRQTAVC